MKQTANPYGYWQRHLDKIGVGGSIFAALCCLGFPALLSLLSAIGLGFLINDAILLPLLIVFLLLTIAGLAMGMRQHRKPRALLLGIVSATALFVFIFAWFNMFLAVLSILGLVAASVQNVLLQASSHSQMDLPTDKTRSNSPGI